MFSRRPALCTTLFILPAFDISAPSQHAVVVLKDCVSCLRCPLLLDFCSLLPCIREQ